MTRMTRAALLVAGLFALTTLFAPACGGDDDGDNKQGITQVERDRLIPPLELSTPSDEPMVQVVKGFECTPEAIGAGDTIADLPDGSSLWIEPAGEDPCHYHLFYDNGTQKQQVSTAPGGYMFALAWQSPAKDLAICGSNIHHELVDGGLREITDVTLECAFRVQGLWTDLVPVVQPEGAWAAWPRSLGLAEGSNDTLELDFVRDSTFNIMNLSDAGRPDDDGLYRISFKLESDGFMVSQPMHMTEPTMNPFTAGAWEPTEADKAELSGVIDFSDGDCPDGCPADPAP